MQNLLKSLIKAKNPIEVLAGYLKNSKFKDDRYIQETFKLYSDSIIKHEELRKKTRKDVQ